MKSVKQHMKMIVSTEIEIFKRKQTEILELKNRMKNAMECINSTLGHEKGGLLFIIFQVIYNFPETGGKRMKKREESPHDIHDQMKECIHCRSP